MNRALPVCVALLISACGGNDREAGSVITDDRSNNSSMDAGTTGEDAGGAESDAGADGDAGSTTDAAGTDDDSGGTDDPDLGGDGTSRGMVCPDITPTEFGGDCDPVRLTGCDEPLVCRLGVELRGARTYLTSWCQEAFPADQLLYEGEECGDEAEGPCAPGLWCAPFTDVCRAICFPDTAVGCEPDEVCRYPDDSWEVGYCRDSCEL